MTLYDLNIFFNFLLFVLYSSIKVKKQIVYKMETDTKKCMFAYANIHFCIRTMCECFFIAEIVNKIFLRPLVDSP